MNTFALELWYDEAAVCTFYTVRRLTDDDASISETDMFFDIYARPGHPLEEKALQLFRLITESIGNKYGAIDDFFDRHANNAHALPPKPKYLVEEIHDLGINFPLRLFCYRVSEQIVILFNGGIKSTQSIQESPDLYIKFKEAQRLVNKIEKDLQNDMIIISDDGRYLLCFNFSSEIII